MQTKQDADILTIKKLQVLISEFKYRHSLYWKLMFRFIYVEVLLFVVYIFIEYSKKFKYIKGNVSGMSLTVFFLVVLFIFGVISACVIWTEYAKIHSVLYYVRSEKRKVNLYEYEKSDKGKTSLKKVIKAIYSASYLVPAIIALCCCLIIVTLSHYYILFGVVGIMVGIFIICICLINKKNS